MKTVLGGESDELDGPAFDVVAFINRKFPDEASLSSLDAVIAAYDAEIQALDQTILESVREQSTAGSLAARDIRDASESIDVLQHKIREIQMKAKATEQLVNDICKDIRGLDIARKHLELGINSLIHLQSLVTYVDKMRRCIGSHDKNYEEVAPSFEGAVQMLLTFSDYLHVPKIKQVSDAVEGIRDALRRSVKEDFDTMLDNCTPSELPSGAYDEGGSRGRQLDADNMALLEGLYLCVDALGSTVRADLLDNFNLKQLGNYRRLFREGATLEGVEGRYAWFKAAMRAIAGLYGKSLPRRWRVEHRLALEFARATRTDLEALLLEYNPPTSVPAEALLNALLKTIAFEKDCAKAYEGADFQAALAGGGEGEGGGSGGGFGGAGGGAGGGGGDEEAFDESQPLYNKDGRTVDPTTAEGIKLKYSLREEWRKRVAAAAERRVKRERQRADIAALGGYDKGKGAAGGLKLGKASLAAELGALPRFQGAGREGIISGAFKPYMAAYVALERAKIDGVVARATGEDVKGGGGGGAGGGGGSEGAGAAPSASILPSSELFFAAARNAFMRCTQLDTGDVLFSLYDNIRQAMGGYTARLQERLPQPVAKPQPGAPGAAAQLAAFPGLQLGGDTYAVPEAEALRTLDACCLVYTTAGAFRGRAREGRLVLMWSSALSHPHALATHPPPFPNVRRGVL